MIAAKVANALALDYPRERLRADRRLRRLHRRHRRARPRRRRRPRPRPAAAAARSPPRTPPPSAPTGEILAFSDANSAWAPDALRRLVEPFADPAVGYVCGQVRFTRRRRRQPRGRLLALRDGGAGDGVGARPGSPPATARSTRCAATPTCRSPPSRQPRPLASPSRCAKRGLRSLYAPAARAEEKMVPTLEGEFARKRRMMVGLWDIVVGEGMLSPRGYPPLFAFELASHRLLRYLDARSSTWSPCSPTSPCSARAGSTSSPSSLQLALLAAALLGRALPLAPLRIARYYVLTTASIAAGLWDRCRHGAAGRLGEGRRGPADAARPRHRSSPPLALLVLSPVPARRRDRDQARQPRAGRSTASAASAATAREFEMLKLRTMVAGLRPGRRRHRRHPRRPPRHRAPAASCAAPRSTRSPTWSTCCAARWRSSARARRSPPRSTTTPRTSTAATRSCPGSPAGPRSRAAPASPGRSGSSSTSGTSTTAAPPSTSASSPRPLWLVVTGQGLAPD